MKLLSGKDLAGFIQERHSGIVRSLSRPPRLAIVRLGHDEATKRYVGVKMRYGKSIGIAVQDYLEAEDTIVERVKQLSGDDAVTGVIIQDVDGLTDGSPFDPATPKAILWLLAGYNLALAGKIVIVGQGRLVGRPLADILEDSGNEVVRCDETTSDVAAKVRDADIIISACGQADIITRSMVKPGAVVVDVGAPQPEVCADVATVTDVKLTPNPGGVGPMTVAALFDNLIIAAQISQKS